MCWRCERGQSTVEAAFALPVLFVAMLMLVQPGIILYDRMVMRAAAADACRMMATRTDASGFDAQRYENLVRRHLGAVPSQSLFHVHEPSCSWEISLEGDERSSQVSVRIANTVQLLPLFDAAGAFAGIADAEGRLHFEVIETCQTQPPWVGASGIDPAAWISHRA